MGMSLLQKKKKKNGIQIENIYIKGYTNNMKKKKEERGGKVFP